MHDPDHPAEHTPAPSDALAVSAGYEAALAAVGRVIAWYGQQIRDERRAPAPDTERIAALAAAQRACEDDQEALADADPAETERIAARYEAQYRELTGS
ncbi:hypothetical protein [Streptomyces sp. NPDC054863]